MTRTKFSNSLLTLEDNVNIMFVIPELRNKVSGISFTLIGFSKLFVSLISLRVSGLKEWMENETL